MIELNYIFAPILGGIIGYITNDVAIRMLFRPHTSKHIFGIHVPFTPGIIPQEKGRIAEALGGVISQNFMNSEYLNRYLLSEEMIKKLRLALFDYFEAQKVNEETLIQFLNRYLSEEEITTLTKNVNQDLTHQICQKLTNEALGEKVANIAMDYVVNKLNIEGVQMLFNGLGGLASGLFGKPIIGRFLNMLREPAERFLAKSINDMLKSNGKEIVSNMVDEEVDVFLNKRVCDLFRNHEEQFTQIADTIENIYRIVITQHLPKILESINISKVVRERINEMDVCETEKLILQVMNKELRAIVWLGAALGLIMGSINCFLL